MESGFLEGTLALVAVAVILTSVLAIGSFAANPYASQGFLPVQKEGAAPYGFAHVFFGFGQASEPSSATVTANIVLGVSGG